MKLTLSKGKPPPGTEDEEVSATEHPDIATFLEKLAISDSERRLLSQCIAREEHEDLESVFHTWFGTKATTRENLYQMSDPMWLKVLPAIGAANEKLRYDATEPKVLRRMILTEGLDRDFFVQSVVKGLQAYRATSSKGATLKDFASDTSQELERELEQSLGVYYDYICKETATGGRRDNVMAKMRDTKMVDEMVDYLALCHCDGEDKKKAFKKAFKAYQVKSDLKLTETTSRARHALNAIAALGKTKVGPVRQGGTNPPFAGACRVCGKKGHKASNCPSNPSKNKGGGGTDGA